MKLNAMTKLKALNEIISDIEAQVTFEDSGHLYTTLTVLRQEAEKLENQIEQLVTA